MATNLLLEGADLEALLLRAHAEGGANAKIVRAEKVRRGGVLGFFAKESFEVAVEIPDTADPDLDAQSAEPGAVVPDGPAQGRSLVPDTAVPEPRTGDSDAPFPAESDGLLGLVDRVSEAEQAAARSAAAVVTRALDTETRPVRVLSPAGSGARGFPSPADEAMPPWDEDLTDGPAADLTEPDDQEEPPQPSTTRPEFTALLDQLRADAEAEQNPGRYADLARPVPEARSRGERLYAEAAFGSAGTPSTTPPITRIPAPRDTSEDSARTTLTPPETAGAASARERSRPRAAVRDQGLVEDRRVLRDLGVPSAWTRRLRGGDRFSAIVRMLDRMPDAELDADLPVVAVVGPAGTATLEAHRTALDLPLEDKPRPVVVVPRDQRSRGAAIARSHRLGVCVVAVETVGYDGDETVTETLQAVEADAVIAVVDAEASIGQSQAWLDALGQVDAIVVDNATATPAIAAPLQLGVPVIRLNGIPLDRITWTAVLCAQLETARPAR